MATLERMLRRSSTLLLSTFVCGCLLPSSVGHGAPQTPAATGTEGTSDYDRVDTYATALRVLKDGVLSDNEGRQHAAMMALRQLRDPSAAPLMTRLLDSDRWALRVDSVLGLAELSTDGRVDLAKVERLPGERDRDAAISAILALRIANAEQVKSMLEWSDLPASSRVLLAGELRRLGQSPDAATITRLAGSKTPEVAGFASCIELDLALEGADATAAKARDLIAALPVATRSSAVAQVAEASAANALKGAGPFIASLIALPELSDEARMRALGSLLTLSPQDAYPELAKLVAADRSNASLLRYAAILLASGARAPAAEWNRFRTGDEALEGIADAGTKLADDGIDGRDVREAAAYRTLVGLERRVVLRAALDGARRVGPSARRAFGLACLDLVLKPGPTPPQLSETLLAALFDVAELAPDQLRPPLAAADLDIATSDAILMSLLNAGTPAAADVARSARGRASRLGEGQIAVLAARNSDKLSPAELDELLRVAGGAVNVSYAVRVQAAWLWLRHSGRTGEAISAICGAKSPAD